MSKRAPIGGGEQASKRSAVDESELSGRVLRHQNRQLGATVVALKRELGALQERITHLETERNLFDATASIIDRSWKLLDADLFSLGKSVGLSDTDFGQAEPPRIESDSNGTLPATSRIITALAEASDCYALADATVNNEPTTQSTDSAQGAGDTAAMDVISETTHIDLDGTLRKRIQWTSHLLGQLIARIGKGEVSDATVILHAQVRALEAKVQLFSSRLSISRARIRELEAALDESKLEVWRLTRRVESAASPSAVTAQTSGASGPINESLDHAAPTEHGSDDPNNQVVPSRNDTPAVFGQAGSESSELRAKLEETNAIAASRLEELERLRDQLKEALSSSSSSTAVALASANSGSKLDEWTSKERQLRAAYERQVDRANSTSLLAMSKLKEAEARIADLEAASEAIIKVADSVLAGENTRLKQDLEEARRRLAERDTEVESLRSTAVARAEAENLVRVLTEERDAYKRRLEEQHVKPGEESDALIAEIEQLSAALNGAREIASRLQQSLDDRDRRTAEVMNEKAALETDIRELREEKSAFIMKTDKLQAMLKENEAFIVRLEERLAGERATIQRAEDMAKATLEAYEKAEQERDEAKREAEMERERAKALDALEDELKQAKLRGEETKWELSRAEEEVKTLKRRLERAKAALEAAAQQQQSSMSESGRGGGGGMRSIDEERLEAMTTALKCPIYKHLWKDCVITKCAHMFSRRALEDNLAARNRKCPSCKNTYSKDDLLGVYLYQSNDG